MRGFRLGVNSDCHGSKLNAARFAGASILPAHARVPLFPYCVVLSKSLLLSTES